MSTRGLIGFVINGDVKTSYNHFDSYPEGLGLEVLSVCKRLTPSVARLAAEALTAIDEDVPPTQEQIDRLADYADYSVGGDGDIWYQLLRNTQGDIGATLEAGFYVDANKFALDSLFCEWGYLINFDTNSLDVYEGFNQSGEAKGVFAGQKGRDSYDPITLIASFSLDNLPEDDVFLKEITKNSRYPDDEDE